MHIREKAEEGGRRRKKAVECISGRWLGAVLTPRNPSRTRKLTGSLHSPRPNLLYPRTRATTAETDRLMPLTLASHPDAAFPR